MLCAFFHGIKRGNLSFFKKNSVALSGFHFRVIVSNSPMQIFYQTCNCLSSYPVKRPNPVKFRQKSCSNHADWPWPICRCLTDPLRSPLSPNPTHHAAGGGGGTPSVSATKPKPAPGAARRSSAATGDNGPTRNPRPEREREAAYQPRTRSRRRAAIHERSSGALLATSPRHLGLVIYTGAIARPPRH